MILISKLVLGSVAMATLAGSVALTDAVEAARGVAASMQWGGDTETRPSGEQPAFVESAAAWQPVAAGHRSGQLPSTLQHCPGRCDIALMFSQLR